MPLRIFVIDREECIRDTFQLFLQDKGHQVITASEPEACLVYQGHDCTKDYPCGHVLFIGYNLPQMNGLDFIERMEERGCKGIMRNKILMSGNTTFIDMQKARQLGCRVLQKPVSLQAIERIISEIEVTVPADEALMAI